RLHGRVCGFALFECFDGLGKFGHVVARGCPAKVTALRAAARVFGFLLGGVFKADLVGGNVGNELLGLFLVVDQNVPDTMFLALPLLVFELVVGGLDLLVCDGVVFKVIGHQCTDQNTLAG